ncbi:hypothetical protein RIR_jg21112.t1 [Rhizophagus irregularis DAOM 181602=DAOM 197198]|nr:hypothetical protein RIR_jg21112.t1 [Rhizophagus irregularis DAOM 181602=DAOM 197198]
MPKVFVTDANPGIDTAIWSKFDGLFNQFKKNFYECQNSLEPKVCTFNTNIFTLNIQITSCSESVNTTFKQFLNNSNSTLIDMFLAINERLEEEQNNNDYANWHNTLLIT